MIINIFQKNQLHLKYPIYIQTVLSNIYLGWLKVSEEEQGPFPSPVPKQATLFPRTRTWLRGKRRGGRRRWTEENSSLRSKLSPQNKEKVVSATFSSSIFLDIQITSENRGVGENNLAIPRTYMIFLAEHSVVYCVKIGPSICQSCNMYLSKLVYAFYILPIFQTKLKFDRDWKFGVRSISWNDSGCWKYQLCKACVGFGHYFLVTPERPKLPKIMHLGRFCNLNCKGCYFWLDLL